jgi:hypothetical protein
MHAMHDEPFGITVRHGSPKMPRKMPLRMKKQPSNGSGILRGSLGGSLRAL